MSNILISKIQINDDVLELKDASARTNISALSTATNQNTTKLNTVEQATNTNTESINTLNTNVSNLEERINNTDNYSISVDSSNETLVFTK